MRMCGTPAVENSLIWVAWASKCYATVTFAAFAKSFLLYKHYKVIVLLVFNEEYLKEKCKEYFLGITTTHCGNIYLA